MLKLHHSLQSLNHLAAFEASARLCSFTKAAEELGVSQPAISQSIRRLEAAIGIQLFRRNHRIISLTDAGAALKDDVTQGLERIEHSIKLLQQRSQGQHVTLSVSSAFAHYWLVPRLQDFRATHPEIDLRMQQTDMDLDLAQEGISLAVWRGTGRWRGYESILLAHESISALASPAWIARNPRIDTLEQLKKCRLITLEEPHRYRPEWKDFFAAFGQAYTDDGTGLRLNDYALVLQAALAGEGVVFGWNHVAQSLVDAGLLVQIGNWTWHSGAGFYLVWSEHSTLSANALITRSWMISKGS
ncbi:MAG: transcriptional regulator [Rhodobacteraceae bacterium]|nr:MAG: transcriptional regulator [Paracoccaceae bacterium]